MQRLQAAGMAVWVTVTDPDEAAAAVVARTDAVIAQGVEAGGHRGTFVDCNDHEDFGLLASLAVVIARVDVPVVAYPELHLAEARRQETATGSRISSMRIGRCR